ncbi:Uncharacterised protein [Mycolicibacterium vanbaalenii]|uniref:Uncharacterized protein n=1 Tax=Mycolicibacterium vanbaalenii TaxID=110539 RepID=A0A5S9R2H5_MYCVN|nr:Uncharacterised protein [Mycolicibacterium vanbaalenii]
MRQNLTRGADGFPQPLSRGWRNEWSESQAYEFLRTRKSRRGRRAVDGVPRLYHDGYGLGPAKFIAAEVLTLPDQHQRPREWLIHRWEPADGRGVVAVAYIEPDYPEPWWAERLLEVLGNGVSAVAVITDQALNDGVDSIVQGRIVVSEYGPDSGTTQTRMLGWFDLANLLRVDIPWWPYGLRDFDAMAAWRPGAAAQAVRPRTDWYDERLLPRLVPAAESSAARECARVVGILNRRIESRIYTADDLDVPGHVERPGVVQVAYPRYAMHDVPDAPDHWELVPLFDARVPNRSDRLAARDCLRRNADIRRCVDYTIRSEPTRGPLAAEWVARLKPLEGDPESLGSAFAEIMLSEREAAQPRTWWFDPHNKACWVVKTAGDVVFATVGTTVPATGHLTELEFDGGRGRAAFFRDSDGVVWPMPPRGYAYHNCGYSGAGPTELAEAVIALRQDASADLVSLPTPVVSGTPLLVLIEETTAPLRVSAEQLDELLPRRLTGSTTS